MYLQYHASKKDTGKENKILFFALCLLYALSVITIVSDLATSLVSAQVRMNILFTKLSQ